ncbi:MAG: preprotein translocase subunit YajC [Aggregatilineales bacterium]
MNDILILLVLTVLGMGAYWTMVLFPKQRDFQKRQRMARELAAGDEVITGGGLIGKVVAIDSDQGVAEVEVSEGVTLRLVTAALIRRYDPEDIAKNAQHGLDTPDEVIVTQ